MNRLTIEDGFLIGQPEAKQIGAIGDYLDTPTEPAVPRLAATVMLVRDSKPKQTKYRIEDEAQLPPNFPNKQNVEVFMLRRVKSMDFVPDAIVFPGGRVDERDSNPDLPWHGPSPAQWAEYLGTTEDDARRIVVAAAREVFEECGVLLAGKNGDSVLSDLSDPSWSKDRAALVEHKLSFADMLIRRSLVLRSDLLGLVSNWLTPEYSTKRFDTFFFSALMPEGQVADGNTTEAQIAAWVTPSYAIHESDLDRWLVLVPTMFNLKRIAEAENAEEFVSQRPKLYKIMNRPIRNETGDIVFRTPLSAKAAKRA